MTLTLNTEELADLTGYVQKKKQIESLGVMGLRFLVNGKGQVKVLRTDVESVHGKEWEPDFENL